MDERCADSSPRPKRILGRDDLPPAVVTNRGGVSPYLLLGDHAGRLIPPSLGDLGLPPEAMDRHIAWDIGIAGLGERLSKLLAAPFIRQTYSRLVIDCNRRPGAADLVPEISDGQVIPGNQGLRAAEKSARKREVFTAYHMVITGQLTAREQQAKPTVLLSLHSFTPVFQGHERPWKYGVLHRGDSALSKRVLALLRAELGEEVGDNQPYAMDTIDYTIPFHADPRGLDYLELEVRQDLIADAAGQTEVAAFLAPLLEKAAG